MRLSLTLIIAVAALLISCKDDDNPVSAVENSDVYGAWIVIEESYVERYEGEEYSETEQYDPSEDNYYNAMIAQFTENNEVVFYGNDSYEQEWYADPSEFSILNNMLIMRYYDEWDSTWYNDTLNIYMRNGRLILYNVWEEDGEYAKGTIICIPYNGDIPPASWTEDITDDQYEPDGTPSEATSVTVGNSGVSHTLSVNDTDWYKFDAVSGEKYLIIVDSYMDNVLYLYDTDGTSMIYYDDDNDDYVETEDYVECAIVYDCDASGAYYFYVCAYDNYYEGYYKASVSKTSLPATAMLVNENISLAKKADNEKTSLPGERTSLFRLFTNKQRLKKK